MVHPRKHERLVHRLRRAENKRWFWLAALPLGAIASIGFEPIGWWPVTIVAFAALFELIAQEATSLRRALLIGWLFGVGQFVLGLNWIATAFTYQAAMPAWLGWVAVVLLSLYLAIYPAMAVGVGYRLGGRSRAALILALAGAWAITEWLRASMFTGFAWNSVGVILVPTPLISLSALVGTYGLSLLVVLLGGALWLELYHRWLPLTLIFSLIAVLWLIPASDVPESAIALKPVRVVQPDIGQQDKWRPGYSETAAKRLAELSAPREDGAGRRLLLWPEAAVTEPLEDARSKNHQAMALFERTRAASLLRGDDRLLTGGIALFENAAKNVAGAANSIFVLGPGGRVMARYDKAHLVPFGEYLPMRPLLSAIGLSRLAPGDTDFAPGPGPRTYDLGAGWGSVGMQLCYEIIFSGHVVDGRNRPDFIFNPSNDAWFGRWGPPQHLAQARLRAAEEGIPVIRATPTGVSAIIDAKGGIVRQLGWREMGVIDGDIPPASNRPTPFALFGNAIPLLLGFLLLVGAIALPLDDRYRRI